MGRVHRRAQVSGNLVQRLPDALTTMTRLRALDVSFQFTRCGAGPPLTASTMAPSPCFPQRAFFGAEPPRRVHIHSCACAQGRHAEAPHGLLAPDRPVAAVAGQPGPKGHHGRAGSAAGEPASHGALRCCAATCPPSLPPGFRRRTLPRACARVAEAAARAAPTQRPPALSCVHDAQGLTMLEIHSNRLTTLPAPVLALTGLVALDLSVGALVRLPSGITALSWCAWRDRRDAPDRTGAHLGWGPPEASQRAPTHLQHTPPRSLLHAPLRSCPRSFPNPQPAAPGPPGQLPQEPAAGLCQALPVAVSVPGHTLVGPPHPSQLPCQRTAGAAEAASRAAATRWRPAR